MTQTSEAMPEDCGHKEWELHCERCFYEVTRLASGEIKAVGEERVGEYVIRGGILFGWHMISVLADIELQLKDAANNTIDLSKRALALNLLKNIHNLSVYVVKTCSNDRLIEAAISTAAGLATVVQERMQENRPMDKPTILLTDVA